MRTRKQLMMASCLVVLELLLASCAPPVAPTPTARPPAPAAKPAGSSPAEPGALTPSPKPAAEQARYGGTLVAANKIAPNHFDMHQETSIGMQLPLSPAYNLLVQNDPLDETKIIGDLAKNWDISPDGLVYTFRLNEGVKFHDDNPLRAEDVKFNLDRIVFPPQRMLSPRKEVFGAVDKIEAVDPLTLKITLKNPQPSFLQLVAMPFNYVYSPAVVRNKGDMKRDVVGSGPFKFFEYVDRISFRVKKNADYFVKGRPYLDGITFYVILDEMVRIAALRTKQVHVLPLSSEITPAQATELKRSDPSLIMHERVNPGLTSLVPNAQVKPWGDVRVRQAVNLAIDREAAGKVIRGGYLPGYGYTMPTGQWVLPEKELMAMPGFRKPKDQDLVESKRLLTEAGYPEGFKFTLLSATQIIHKETGQVLKDQLGKIGIVVDIRVEDTTVAKQIEFEGRFEALSKGDASAVDDPDILLGEYFLTGSPKNWGRWSNPKFDELYREQSKTLDTRKRLELVWDMQRLLHRESPRAIVVWSRRYGVFWPQVKDWLPGKSLYSNHRFQDVWLTK
ncbi:MAG: ABC transporter substrate-binding protein [Chloroflexi bacterium]|nr:ABC transporter substrate-binding protein [Chloroflexota bacterium]